MEKVAILYLTKNKLNNKIYIGVHTTFDIKDDYLGSGVLFKKALKKYGKNNFKRYILQISKDIDLIYNLENKIVTQDFVNKDFNYNLGIGGNKVQHSELTKRKIGLKSKGRKARLQTRVKMSQRKKGKGLLSENNNAKKVINLDTNQIFNSIKEACEFEKGHYPTFKWQVKYKQKFNYRFFEDGL